MYLERAKVTNFRGIRRLSVDFESDSTFLIGENQWGKTSLLKVLWMLLGQGEELCQFDKSDLYVPIKIEKALMKATRRDGTIDFAQGDTKGIGSYSQIL